ncbi:MAG: 16S rRNA (uracil(1498)-N(3))-methyltransferase [Bacteroidales bacterium]|nr:16S rRNA (uracil(1498)-N(3))-methyltransferase [Bacteroidales bacterium]
MELFYLPYLYEGSIHITDKNIIRHLFALRLKKGDSLYFTDGNGNRAFSIITEIKKANVQVQITKIESLAPPEKKIILFVSPLKNPSRFEWLVEKATELNVHSIVPILTKRTEGHLKKIERLKQLIITASLQSQRVFFPEIHNPFDFSKAIQQSNNFLNLIAYCGICEKKVSLPQICLKKKVAIWIGPEGDFTEDEIMVALKNNFIPITLGQQRLRSETAAISALSFVYLHNCTI